MTLPTAARYIWASPASAIGALASVPAVLLGATFGVNAGVLEVTLYPRSRVISRAVARLPFAAITLGHVVLARSREEQASLRPHERAHVSQYEQWGLAFLVAYPLESLLQLLLGRRPYLDNRFEVAARASEARAVRLDSLGWARYGFGAEAVVRARMSEIASLAPGRS